MNIVITGATKGIGKAIATAFALEGANLLVCSRNYEELKTFKQEMLAINTDIKVWIKKADVSKKKDVLAFAKYITKNVDQVNVLVNNAGNFITGNILEEEDGILEQLIETNLYSAFHLTRALLPLLKNSKKGHIFNMCSIASKKALPNCGSYCISKFALLGFSKALREELKEQKIKVTSLLPGATWSNAWAGVELPATRLMEAQDIAKMVVTTFHLGDSAVVEEIVMRPQLGDL